MTRFFFLSISAIWLCAFVLALMPMASLEAESYGLAVLLMGVVTLSVFMKSTSSGYVEMPRSSMVFVGLAFWALALVSVFLSGVQSVSFLYFWSFSLFPLSFLTCLLMPSRKQIFRLIGIGGAAVLLLLSVATFYQYFTYGYAAWPMANPNMLAALLSLGFFAALGRLLWVDQNRDRVIASMLGAFMLMAVVLTQSHGALMAMAAAAIILIVSCRKRVMTRRKELGFVFVFTLIIVSVPTLMVGHSPVTFVFDRLAADGDLSLFTRGEIWASSFQILRDHAFTGTGIGTFFLYYPEYRGADYISAGLMAHSDPLQFAIEMGVLAPILFYSFVVIAVVQTWKAVIRMEADDPRRVLVLTPFCALGALVAHAHVSFPFYTPGVLIMAGAFLAFWMVQVSKETRKVPLPRVIKGLAVVFVFVGLLAFGALVSSEVMVKRADQALAQFKTEEFGVYVNAADKLSLGRNAKAHAHAADFKIGVIESSRPFLSKEETEAFFEQAHGHLDDAKRYNPRLAVIPTRRAKLAELKGDEEGMEKYLRAALDLDPLYLPARLTLIRLYRRQGRKAEAETLFREGLEWPYRFPAAGNFYRDAIGVFEKAGDEKRKETARKKLKAFVNNGGEKALSTIF